MTEGSEPNKDPHDKPRLAEYATIALLLLEILSVDYVAFYKNGDFEVNLKGRFAPEPAPEPTNVDRLTDLLNSYDSVKLDALLDALKSATKTSTKKRANPGGRP